MVGGERRWVRARGSKTHRYVDEALQLCKVAALVRMVGEPELRRIPARDLWWRVPLVVAPVCRAQDPIKHAGRTTKRRH
jgi:hypothetical protein